jgi:hypothetical protein
MMNYNDPDFEPGWQVAFEVSLLSVSVNYNVLQLFAYCRIANRI